MNNGEGGGDAFVLQGSMTDDEEARMMICFVK
jgi:hypothetical protein